MGATLSVARFALASTARAALERPPRPSPRLRKALGASALREVCTCVEKASSSASARCASEGRAPARPPPLYSVTSKGDSVSWL